MPILAHIYPKADSIWACYVVLPGEPKVQLHRPRLASHFLDQQGSLLDKKCQKENLEGPFNPTNFCS